MIAAGGARADVPVSTSETTIGYNNQRTNWDASEPGLSPSAVTASDFGKIFDTTLPNTTSTTPNQIYAQPIVADNVLIVVTEEDQINGLDPQSGAVLWTMSVGVPFTPATCGDLTPHIGITSTPVYDPTSDSVYFAAKTSDSGVTNYRLHAIDPLTGNERSGWPVTITGTFNGIPFDPDTANQRPGLLLLNGVVYLGFASHCDQGPYVGWVIGVSTTHRTLSLWTSESQHASAEAGIWQSGGGLASDGDGQILLATGNGVSPPPGPGTSPPGTLAESVVRLQVGGGGSLSATDFFSPANNANLDQSDADLGSGGPIVLPDSFGTPSHPHLLLQCGKDGVVRLLDRDSLGGMGQGPNGTDAQLSSIHLKGLWGRFAAFPSDAGNYVFLLPTRSPLQALRISANPAGVPTLALVSTGSDIYGYSSGSPVVTSSGSAAGSAVIWVVTVDGSTGSNGYLRAYGVPPAAGTWSPLASFPLGTMAKFVQPATANGRVYVGTRDGRVLAFGRPVISAVSAPSTDFGLDPVNQQTTPQDITVTAVQDVTIKSVSTAAPFSADTSALTFPMTVSAGATFTVPVTFTPSAAGSVSGALTIVANDGGPTDDTYQFALHGIGTADGLLSDPSSLAFGSVSTGMARQLGVVIQNSGATTETIQTVVPPSAPFSLLDAVKGTTLAPQESVTLTVQFAPTAGGSFTDQLQLAADKGPTLSIPITATAITGSGQMALNTSSLAFGNVSPGSTRTLAFVITNTGSADLTINKAAPPVPPFIVPSPISEGQTLSPGDSLTVQVKYVPTTAEPASDQYVITGDGGQGAMSVGMSGNQNPWVGPVSWPGGCLQLNAGSQTTSAAAVSSTCGATTGQQFTIDPTNQTVQYGTGASALCLDVKGGGTASGTPVQFYTCNGTTAERWVWRADDSLYNPVSARCLDVQGGSTTASTPLWLYNCNNSDAQYWNLASLQAARGIVSSGVGALNQLCIDDRYARTADGTPIQIYGCNLKSSQIITHVGVTLHLLGKCIGTASGGTANGTKIQLQRCSGAAGQRWKVGTNASLVNPVSTKCLDDPGATTTLSTQLQLWTCNGSVAQRWTLPG